jgi:hypothetical protein
MLEPVIRKPSFASGHRLTVTELKFCSKLSTNLPYAEKSMIYWSTIQ